MNTDQKIIKNKVGLLKMADMLGNGKLIIENDGQHPPVSRKGSAELTIGAHRIRVSYFQGPRFQVALTLGVAGPSQKWHLFSTDEPKPPSDAGVWRSPADAELVVKH